MPFWPTHPCTHSIREIPMDKIHVEIHPLQYCVKVLKFPSIWGNFPLCIWHLMLSCLACQKLSLIVVCTSFAQDRELYAFLTCLLLCIFSSSSSDLINKLIESWTRVSQNVIMQSFHNFLCQNRRLKLKVVRNSSNYAPIQCKYHQMQVEIWEMDGNPTCQKQQISQNQWKFPKWEIPNTVHARHKPS